MRQDRKPDREIGRSMRQIDGKEGETKRKGRKVGKVDAESRKDERERKKKKKREKKEVGCSRKKQE